MNLFPLKPCSDERQNGFKLFKTKQRRRQKIMTDEDENRKIIAAEALKNLDEVKKIHRSERKRPFEYIFNELIENVEQMKLKNPPS